MISAGHPITFDDIMVIAMTKLPDVLVLEMSNLTNKKFKDPKWRSEAINQSTGNTMAKKKKRKMYKQCDLQNTTQKSKDRAT